MYLTIQGIVLRVTDYNDKDALLTMLTRRHGRLTVKARGLRRKNSPLIAPCQLLSYGEFTLFEYRGQYTINEAQSIELFTPLRRDLTKLSLGTYFAQVSEVLSQEDMPNPELQSLLLNCLRPFQAQAQGQQVGHDLLPGDDDDQLPGAGVADLHHVHQFPRRAHD